MRLIIFTAMLGDTYALRAPDVLDRSARYVCFTDGAAVPKPYERILVPSSNRPSFESRRIKILADHPALADADATLWHDASYRLIRDVRWVHRRLADADLVAMRHPRRTRIEDEAPMIARYGYVTIDQAMAHVARYRAAGFADDVLTSAGLLARRSSPAVAAFNRLWWSEVQHWNGRDQGSVDYAAWATKLRVCHIKGTVRSNVFAGWRGAAREAVPA